MAGQWFALGQLQDSLHSRRAKGASLATLAANMAASGSRAATRATGSKCSSGAGRCRMLGGLGAISGRVRLWGRMA